MDKEQKTELALIILGGLATMWRSYKRSVWRRSAADSDFLWTGLFGLGRPEANDVDAAKQLAIDVCEIRENFRPKSLDQRTEPEVDNSSDSEKDCP